VPLGDAPGVAISLYKHPNARKGRYCVICLDRTRGPAQLVRLAFGVEVHLCAEHASPEFQTMRMGRDFTLTLHHAWSSAGCLTARRRRALEAHEAELRKPRRDARGLPGSYTWPTLRDETERRAAAGESADSIARDLRARHAADVAHAPSVRTVQRWVRERRWTDRRPVPAPAPRRPDPPSTLAGALAARDARLRASPRRRRDGRGPPRA
jgi:hypothetical protein